jgi:CHASE3 domain sensor protein
MNFSKLKIGTKFSSTFALLIGLFLLVVGTAFYNLRTMNTASTGIPTPMKYWATPTN